VGLVLSPQQLPVRRVDQPRTRGCGVDVDRVSDLDDEHPLNRLDKNNLVRIVPEGDELWRASFAQAVEIDLRAAKVERGFDAAAERERLVERSREEDRRPVADLDGHADDTVDVLEDRFGLLVR